MITICFLWVLSFNIKGFRKMDMQGLIREIEIFVVDVFALSLWNASFLCKDNAFRVKKERMLMTFGDTFSGCSV